MAGGVRAGAATPNQFSTSNPASPDSASDGTSASDAARFALVTASMRTRLPATSGWIVICEAN